MLQQVHGSELINTSLSLNFYLIYSFVGILLILLSGLMSGLTVGLMSIDELDLEMKLATGTPTEKKQARKVLSVISHHHLVLVTLLLTNAACMEGLPIILAYMFNTVISVIISITFVMSFGEILPQAIFTGPDQLKIAYKLVPVVQFFTFLLFPITYPIAKLLDRLFGHSQSAKRLHNKDLKAFVALHQTFHRRNSSNLDEGQPSGLMSGQINIIHGAIDMREEIVLDHMILIEKVFCLSEDTVLDKTSINHILKQGYSRIPIFSSSDKSKVKGIMLVKSLLGIELGNTVANAGVKLRDSFTVEPQMSLLDLLAKFREGRIHMAIVAKNSKIYGIITMENLLEEILKTDILDEDDFDKLSSFLSGNSISKINNQQKKTTRVRKPYSALHPRFDDFSMSLIN